jgi:D-glycero-alpha-D-manno-heptose-7-phosphate kinase
MVITRTPFRISFFGGGTDYPAWYRENRGAVLATTINKYCYISCRYLPPFFEHKSRIIYSKMEQVKKISEIQHPSVRACLEFMKVKEGVEIHHDGDLPARTGLGSSSSFTVGLISALYALRGDMISKMTLAQKAICIEQEKLKENVGSQDQISAAFGGFNLIEFNGDRKFRVQPITINEGRLDLLQDHLLLFFTGLSRYASEIAKEQIKRIPQNNKELKEMFDMVHKAVGIINSDTDISKFGKLLHESWQLKRSLSSMITTPEIDEIYSSAIRAGAIGGKLLGAGGGGFILFFARPEVHPKIKKKLKHLLYVPFEFENFGSQIIFYDPSSSRERSK